MDELKADPVRFRPREGPYLLYLGFDLLQSNDADLAARVLCQKCHILGDDCVHPPSLLLRFEVATAFMMQVAKGYQYLKPGPGSTLIECN